MQNFLTAKRGTMNRQSGDPKGIQDNGSVFRKDGTREYTEGTVELPVDPLNVNPFVQEGEQPGNSGAAGESTTQNGSVEN
jgi:hypothetical protein